MSSYAKIIDNVVSVSDFTHGKTTQIFNKVTKRNPVTVLKNNKPIAVISDPEDFLYHSEIEEDVILLQLALSRLEANNDETSLSHSEVLNQLELQEEELLAIDDNEIVLD